MAKQQKNINFKQERTRIYDDKRQDPYRTEKKHPDPTICTECGALFTSGRWSWNDIPEETSQALCPACRRIRDNDPAGVIEISGTFSNDHRSEIMNMIMNIARKEISRFPLERIIAVEGDGDKTVITTTGEHIARRIGTILFNAYEGELDYHCDDENVIRVYWQR